LNFLVLLRGTQGEEISHICQTLKHNAIIMQRNTYMLYDSSETAHDDMTRYQQKEDVLCNELARKCISYTMEMFPIEPIHFDTELPDDFTIRTNQLYLMRTISELLFNAAKFSDGQHISLSITQKGDFVRFTIQDVGPGLPKDSIDLIFLPFTKVDDLAEGLGLGLPLCKMHAKALGGKLICDESYQQGCRIIVELPKDK
jgi:signal transduction histidine kinase